MTGQTVSHYKILERLGGGGMGIVYKAQDLKLDRLVALKFLPPELTHDPEAKERFIHEAKAASALQHSNICVVYDIGETSEGELFICMEHLDGDTLNKKLQDGPLSVDEAVRIALQVARGLSRAHEAGIVHRDIKPANIMVTSRGEVKIVDFGLAKLSGRTVLTKSGTTVGTAAYMSPEQARGEEIDARTDIWSLGVVLYEILAGKRPFDSDYDQALVYSILHDDPKPMRELRSDVPEAIEKIWRRAMAKDLKNRYQTAAELIADLESYTAGSQLLKATRRLTTRRQRFILAGAVSVILAVMCGAVYFLFPSSEPIDSIAVLPFDNLSRDSTQQYLSDGLTSELITNLFKIGSLRVASWTSVKKYRTTSTSLADIARELQARAILEGTMTRVGDRVKVEARLLEPSKGKSLWAESYEYSISEVQSLQNRITTAIAEEVNAKLTKKEQERLSMARKVNPKAYELYLKARRIEWIDENAYRAALGTLEQATVIDSTYPAFYSTAAAWYLEGVGRGYFTADELISRMEKAVERALSIDTQDSDAQLALAKLLEAKWDWSGAEAAYLRALEISPGNAEIHQAYSVLILGLGRFEEAIARHRRACELDPLMDVSGLDWMTLYLYSKRFDDAIRVGRNSIQRFPEDPLMHALLGYVYAWKGNCDSALIFVEKALALNRSPAETWVQLNCAQAAARCGRRQRAMEYLNQYLASRKGKTIESFFVASTYIALGETANGYYWLEKAYRDKSYVLISLKIDAVWDGEHSNPRFRDMAKRVGLDK